MVDLVKLKSQNEARWAAAKLTRGPEFIKPAQNAVAHKSIYQNIEHRTGVPWTFIAVTHYRESSQDFTKNLGQGDPLNRITVHVPAGRGPFTGLNGFADGAVDALENCAPHAARETDWTIGGMLTLLERYNGIGYAARGLPSPYVWSGTNQYKSGKYVSDGVFDPNVVDKQLGCAGMILAMMAIDPSIQFVTVAPPVPAPVAVVYDAAWLQTSLNLLGANPPLQVDGIVGAGTRLAVRSFQISHNLQADGIAGTNETIPAILGALAARPVAQE
jgi:lysozyme family protein